MNRPKKQHELHFFMRQTAASMGNQYERIHQRATEDPGTAGDDGEENWSKLLADWLPPTYRVRTKGRILFEDAEASPQVDVVVLRPSYPPALENTKYYLAGGVAAAFECKTTLRAEHLAQAAKTAAQIQRSARTASSKWGIVDSPYRQLFGPIVYGVLAHAHCWAMDTAASRIHNYVERADRQFASHPRETMDVITVANVGTWSITKAPYRGPREPTLTQEQYESIVDPEGRYPEGYSWTAWSGPASSNINPGQHAMGGLIKTLIERFAWEDESLRSLAQYYHAMNLAGVSAGAIREWPLSVLGKRVQAAIEPEAIQPDRWNEWRPTFP